MRLLHRQEIDDLPLVMAEIAMVMSARGTALTIHPSDGVAPRVLYADKIGADIVERLLSDETTWDYDAADGNFRWLNYPIDHACKDILLVPVALTEGHSRLLITIYFDHLNDTKRREAEAIYLRRAPFAIGYFRLWQIARTRVKALAALKAALNLTSMAIILLDRANRIAFANSAADAMLAEADGLRRVNNSIRAAQIADSVRLQVAIDHVIAANADGGATSKLDRHSPMVSLERSGRPALIVSILPTEEIAIESHDVAAIVYAIDPSIGVGDLIRPICKIYGLSLVETQLTCNLVDGQTLSEAAAKMRIKEMTARSYLKQIFLKTDTHRQTELVQLMLSSIIRTSSDIVALPL